MKYAGPGDEETFLGTPSNYARFDVSRAEWAERREQGGVVPSGALYLDAVEFRYNVWPESRGQG